MRILARNSSYDFSHIYHPRREHLYTSHTKVYSWITLVTAYDSLSWMYIITIFPACGYNRIPPYTSYTTYYGLAKRRRCFVSTTKYTMSMSVWYVPTRILRSLSWCVARTCVCAIKTGTESKYRYDFVSPLYIILRSFNLLLIIATARDNYRVFLSNTTLSLIRVPTSVCTYNGQMMCS